MSSLIESTLNQVFMVKRNEFIKSFIDLRNDFYFKILLVWGFLLLDDVCKTQAVSAQDTTVLVDEDSGYSEIFSD